MEIEVFEVRVTVDEYSTACAATCDSEEAALEYAKHVSNWFRPCSLYEDIQANPRDKDLYIKKKTLHILSTADVKEKFKK